MSAIYRFHFVAAAALALCVSLASADVMEFEVFKLHFYQQLSASPPASPLVYAFYSDVYAEGGDATLITVNGTPLMEEFPGEWYIEGEFASQAALDAAAPGPSFDLHLQGGALGVRNEKVLLNSPEVYPAAPALTPTSYNTMQNADASQDLLIEWNPADASTDLIFMEVYSPKMDMYIIEAEMPASQTSFLIPAGTLDPDETYEIEIAFGNGGFFTGHAPPGFGVQSDGLAGYAAITIINLQTVLVGPCDDVGQAGAVKVVDYIQSADNTEPTDAMGYSFDVFVDTVVDGATLASVSDGGAVYLLNEYDPGIWDMESDIFATQPELDAQFPSNTLYTVHLDGGTLGTRDQEIFVGPNNYPPAPFLVGTGFSDLQGMDPSQDLTISWNAAPGNVTHIFAEIYDVSTDTTVLEFELAPSTTSIMIFAGDLDPDTLYEFELDFGVAPEVPGDDCPGFGTGSTILSGFASATLIEFATMGDDSCVVPVQVGSIDTSGTARDIAIVGEIAYIADDNAGLQIIDVSDQSTPVLLATYDTPNNSYGIFATGQTAYIADGGSGLQIVDAGTPSSPNFVGSYNTPNWAWDVTVVGVTAYVADGNAGLQILDISDPTSPSLLGAFDTSGTARGVMVVGSTAYIADGTSGLVMIDVSNPISPNFLGSYDTPGTARGLNIDGTTAYVADDNMGLQIIDVSDPTSPFLLGSFDTIGAAFGVSVVGTTAYVAESSAGFQAIDVTDPFLPIELAVFDTAGFTNEIAISGESAFLADGGSGMHIIYVTNTCVEQCPADLTGDGILNFFDVSVFLQAFNNQLPDADFTGDGVFNFFDISLFLQAFNAGCP